MGCTTIFGSRVDEVAAKVRWFRSAPIVLVCLAIKLSKECEDSWG